MIYPTIDSDFFYDGFLFEAALNPINLARVVKIMLPEEPLGQFQKWRWVTDAWRAEIDYRGNIWYNPEAIDQVHKPCAPNDAPPPGWLHWVPGENKQVGDAEALIKAKGVKWTQIKQARITAEYAGFTWYGSTFDSDAISQQRITGAVSLAMLDSAFTIDWTLKDNTVRTMNATDMIAVGVALGTHVATQFSHGQALRAQIEAATDQAGVESVVW